MNPRTEPPERGAGLREDDRKKVLWLGGDIPRSVEGSVLMRDMRVVQTTPDKLEALAPFARALIIEYGDAIPDFSTMEAVLDRAIVHGLGVAIIKQESAGYAEYEADTKPVSDSRTSVKRFHGNVEATVHFAHTHRPGPGANLGLLLNSDRPGTIDHHETQILLRRALFDHTAVSLRTISDGRSGAMVWIATPGSDDRGWRSRPWLIKLHDPGSIALERGNLRSAVENCMPIGTAPRICEERCVVGVSKALLVQDFIENAIPFRDAWRAQVPDTLFAALFGGAFRDWYRLADPVAKSLGNELTRIKAFRWTTALEEAAASAKPDAMVLSQLRTIVSGWPELPYLQARIHGDLHRGNLFVFGPGQVCVIDFESVTSAPVIADAACLEVSLIFGNPGSNADKAGERLPDAGSASARKWLEKAYTYPLDPAYTPNFPNDQKASDALRAIRGEARKCEADGLPYAIAVSAYLIRTASFPDNPLEDRTLAYELTSSLIRQINAEITKRGIV